MLLCISGRDRRRPKSERKSTWDKHRWGAARKDTVLNFSVCLYHWDEFHGQKDPAEVL